eukprot:g34065.t1
MVEKTSSNLAHSMFTTKEPPQPCSTFSSSPADRDAAAPGWPGCAFVTRSSARVVLSSRGNAQSDRRRAKSGLQRTGESRAGRAGYDGQSRPDTASWPVEVLDWEGDRNEAASGGAGKKDEKSVRTTIEIEQADGKAKEKEKKRDEERKLRESWRLFDEWQVAATIETMPPCNWPLAQRLMFAKALEVQRDIKRKEDPAVPCFWTTGEIVWWHCWQGKDSQDMHLHLRGLDWERA